MKVILTLCKESDEDTYILYCPNHLKYYGVLGGVYVGCLITIPCRSTDFDFIDGVSE